MKVPKINSQYACIVDWASRALAAVISSYLFEPETYLPVFLLRAAKVPKTDDSALMDDAYFASVTTGQDAVFISNALARVGGTEYLILAGLSDAQKSYLIPKSRSKVVQIGNISEVESELSPLGLASKQTLKCRMSDLLKGLYFAERQRLRLVIEESAPPVPEVAYSKGGIVLVENVADASAVIAINYANSICADAKVVEPLPEHEGRAVQYWIQDWKEKNNHQQFDKLNDTVSRRIRGVPFSQFDFATFFTEGLPYSLILENVIPCSYVNLSIKPGLFVFNNLLFSEGDHFHSAVVFSPTFFPEEETTFLCNLFDASNLYVRSLTGQTATLANFDFHAQYFPYDLLHICSHGGEVEGYEMTERFKDTDGNNHIVQFDEVIGVSPVPDKPDKVYVHSKMFPRKLDGFDWRSPELEAQEYPAHVFHEMWRCMMESKGRRKVKGRIATSCSIACTDSIHQGEFDALASHSSPLIFNNTCWSWHEVSSFFLGCGARGYIGTLWAIDNESAVTAAKTFYENVFVGSVLSAFHKALKSIEVTASKNIYIYWGLHFNTLPNGLSIAESQATVRAELERAVRAWVKHIRSAKSPEIKRNSLRVLKLILRELVMHFDSGNVRKLEAEANSALPELRETAIVPDNMPTGSSARGSSLDRPIYQRKANEPNV